jgi:hypothetical protein
MADQAQSVEAIMIEPVAINSATNQGRRIAQRKQIAVQQELIATLTVWRGDDSRQRRSRINQAESDHIAFNFNQGFSVLQPIILQHLRSRLPSANSGLVSPELSIKVKPTVESPQSRFVALNEGNFITAIIEVWNNSLRRQRLLPENVRIPLPFFMPEGRQPTRSGTTAANTSRRRATAARIAEARQEIVEHMQMNPADPDSNLRVGAIATNVWSRQRARQVVAEPIEHLPQANRAFQQAMRLDYLRERRAQEPVEQEWGQLPIKWQNSDPGMLSVHLPTLRRLLGLPMYPLFDRDIFHERETNIPLNVEQDIDDINHLDEIDS